MSSVQTSTPYNSMMLRDEQAELLRDLFQPGDPLLLVNAWDAPSARLMVVAGAPAIVTTSAGIAFSLGYADGRQLTRKQLLAALDVVVRAVDIPVIAEVETGDSTPTDLARTARGVVNTGAVGLQLGDAADTGGLLPVDDVARRIAAVRAVGDKTGVPLVVIARVDVFIDAVGDPATRLDDAIERGFAYLDEGADCVFVPGVVAAKEIGQLVSEMRGRVGVLATPRSPTVIELKRLGVAGVMLGSTAYRAALSQTLRIADEIYTMGTFASLANAEISYADVQLLLGRASSGHDDRANTDVPRVIIPEL
jgi:2-methylisocitrate lyase-like PEP mutase family enzyme